MDSSQDLIGDGSRFFGELFHGDLCLVLFSDQNNLVADRSSGSGDVQNRHVHRHPSHHRSGVPADQRATGIGKLPIESIVVADGDHRHLHRPSCFIRDAVADEISRRNVLDLRDACLPAQNRLERDLFAPFSCRHPGLSGRPNPISADPDPHHAEMGLGIEENSRRRRGVNETRLDAGAFRDLEGLTESLELKLGERRIQRVFDVGKVGVHSFDPEARKLPQLSQEAFQLRDRNSQSVSTGLHFDMRVGGPPRVARRLGETLGHVEAENDLVETVADHFPGAALRCVTENSDRLFDAQAIECQRFIQRVHTEPIGLSGDERCDLGKAMTVSIRLHYDHEGAVGIDQASEGANVRAQTSAIDLDPGRALSQCALTREPFSIPPAPMASW